MSIDSPQWDPRIEYADSEIVRQWRHFFSGKSAKPIDIHYVHGLFRCNLLHVSKSENLLKKRLKTSGGLRGEEPVYSIRGYLVFYAKGRDIARAENYLFSEKLDTQHFEQPLGVEPDVLLDDFIDFYSVAERWLAISGHKDIEYWEGVCLQLLERGLVFLHDGIEERYCCYSEYGLKDGVIITSEGLLKKDLIKAEILLGLRKKNLSMHRFVVETEKQQQRIADMQEEKLELELRELKSKAQLDLHGKPEAQHKWMLNYEAENNIDTSKPLADEVLQAYEAAAIKAGMTINSFRSRCRERNPKVRGIDRRTLKK